MDSFYDSAELKLLGFKKYGNNVKISRKCSVYGAENIVLGDNVRIDDFCILSGKIELGNYIHIAAYSAIYGGDKGVYIKDFSNISSMVSIYSISDDYSGMSMTNPMIPDDLKNVDSRAVYIDKHVIVGSHSIILPGTTLKEGSAFGAFSLINHDSEEWTINTGIPFVKLRDRNKHILDLEKVLMNKR